MESELTVNNASNAGFSISVFVDFFEILYGTYSMLPIIGFGN